MKKNMALLMVVTLLMCFTACNNTPESTCWSCGKSISAEVSFCGYCGAAVKDSQSEPTTTADPTETITGSDSTVTTDPSAEGTKPSEQPTETQKPTHTHSYSKKVTSATCTQQGYTTYTCSCGDSYTADQTAAKGHSYNKKVTEPTCTEKGYTTYTCACGNTYKDDYVNPSHNYVNNVCSRCGAANANYTAYQSEYAQLTDKYNADVAELQNKIATSQSNIEKSQQAINNARGTLATLSPSCPSWYIQQFVGNYGSQYPGSWYATEAAQRAWTEQYNSQKAQCESTISAGTSRIQTEQTNISMYNTAISTLTSQYNNDVSALKVKYGMS